MPGKQALYQRVLALPGAALYTQVGGTSKAVTPFSAFYVYARTQKNAEDWLQVGSDRHGGRSGWLRRTDTLEWNQGLTVAFRAPQTQDRALLFQSAEDLQAVANPANLSRYQTLYQAAVSGQMPSDSPIVAIQPPGKLDIRENFYLVPIREHRDIFVGSERARMLRVATVPLKTNTPSANPTQPGRRPPPSPSPTADRAYRAGLVFAIDSTLSMQPYIDRTHQAVQKIHDNLAGAHLLDKVNFGLVAFRDALQPAPELEYLTQTFVDLQAGRNPTVFLERVRSLQAAQVSSQDTIEDVFAGVATAIQSMDWTDHPARYVVLITDAGPRNRDDPLSSTGLDANALREMAQAQGIAIFVLHLLSPRNADSHAQAAQIYQTLSDFPGVGSLYYGVPTGDVREFGLVLDTVATQIAQQVQALEHINPLPQDASPAVPNQLATLQDKVQRLGYALQLRYLQATPDKAVPRVFDAWLLDRAIRNPEQPTLDIQVLLTRDQLSDLHDVLRQVLQTAEEGLLSPQNFLNDLKSLAATMTRDPSQLGTTTATTAGAGSSLADLGFMREYIADLPYAGEVMNLSLEDWAEWPAAQQIDFLRRLEQKITYYQTLHDHTDLWISLDQGPIDGDAVFPLPLEMLP